MEKVIKIAVIGDFDDSRPSHVATHKALQHSASALSTNIEIDWISTHPLENINNSKKLKGFDGVWGASGDPDSSLGLTNAIQVARENNIPYLGT